METPTAEPVACLLDRCGGRIIFARHAKTRSWMPLDAEPTDPEIAGWELVAGDEGQLLTQYVAGVDRPGRTDLHVPHWATCVDPVMFRRLVRNQKGE